MSLQRLAPDFAIGVKHCNVPPKDDKTRKAASNDESNLKVLLEVLEKYGFKVQIRAGADKESELLVFVKIASKVYEDLVKKDLLKNYEFGLTDDDSAQYNKQRLIYEYLTDSQSLGGVGLTPGAGEWKFVTSIVSLDGHLVDINVPLIAKQELKKPDFSTSQIRLRYGPAVALFFNFVRFYIFALAGLSVFGLIGFLKSKNYSIAYSFINLIWTAGFLVLWRRRGKFLAYSWGVQNSLELERFCSDISSGDGVAQDSKEGATANSQKGNDTDKKRFVKQLLFFPVAAGLGFVLLMAQGLCFVLEIFISEVYDGPGKTVLTLAPTIILSTFVPVFTIVYNIVIEKFLVWEDHNSHLTRSQSFAIKSFLLSIMTGYVPLLISAFIYLPFAHLLQPNLIYIKRAIAGRIRSDRYAYSYLTSIKSSESFQINQGRLDSQYFYFIVTNQVIGSVLKFGLPLIITPVIKFVTKKLKGSQPAVEVKEDPEEKAWLERVRHAASLPDHSVDDSFRDVALQFGYVAIFGSIWTLAPLICLIFNVLNFKLEQWRLASGLYFKPVVARRTDTIYPWDIAFFFLAWLGSIVSPLVASFYRHGAKPPKKFGSFGFDKASINVGSTVGLVTLLLLSEHLFFALVFIGGKLSDLFKSSAEVENDNFHNTLILKRQQFSGKELPEINCPDDSAWTSFTTEEALSQVKSLNFYEASPEEVEKISSLNKGISSGVNTTPASDGASTLENKKRILEEKKRELARLQQEKEEQLRLRSEKGDSVINTIDTQGNPTSAIIDDNSHVPTTGIDYEKDIDAEAHAARNKEYIEQENGAQNRELNGTGEADKKNGKTSTGSRKSSDIKSNSSSADESSKKSSRKKSLKNLLKRK